MNEKTQIDIKENSLRYIDTRLLPILLTDKTTGNHLLWATDNYIDYGSEYSSISQMFETLIIGHRGNVIKPRVEKSRFFSLGLFKAFYEKTDFALQFVRLAFEKARADGNEVANTLPEKYWRDAALECGLINFANTELEDMFGKNILEEWKL